MDAHSQVKTGKAPIEQPRAAARALSSPKRVVRNGDATNDLVWSASAEGNDRIFPRILDLYVKPGSIVADVTYGKGVFWRNVTDGRYELRATDIQDGVDCRALPYGDGEVDCVVLDPPYMHSPGGTAHRSHTPFEDHYPTTAPAIEPGANTTKRCSTCIWTPDVKRTGSFANAAFLS